MTPLQEIAPLVSIIVVTYNSAKYIEETLESAKHQTYEHIDLIISDDCSQDGTVEICSRWIEKNSCRFKNVQLLTVAENTGIPANFNRGLAAAKGAWIKWIAGDDALMDNCVETFMIHIKNNPHIEVLHANVQPYKQTFLEENKLPLFPSKKLKINQPDISPALQFEILLRISKIWAASLMVKRSLYDRVGHYDESVTLWEDRPMLLRMTQLGVKLHYLDFISCKYRKNENSVQKTKAISRQLIPNFAIQREEYYAKNYLKYLPFFERTVKHFLIWRKLILVNLNLNTNNVIIRSYLLITELPFKLYLKKLRKKFY